MTILLFGFIDLTLPIGGVMINSMEEWSFQVLYPPKPFLKRKACVSFSMCIYVRVFYFREH